MKHLSLIIYFTSLVTLPLKAQSWDELNQRGMDSYYAGKQAEAIAYFEKAEKTAEKKIWQKSRKLSYCMQ